jgi:hypothetical protein
MPESLPFVRRRKSPMERAMETAQSAMRAYTSLKIAQAGPRAAGKVAKAVRSGNGDGGGGAMTVGRWVAIPAGAAAGFVLFRRVTRGNPVTESPPKGWPQKSEVSPGPGGMGAPAPGEPGGPKSATTTASPPPPPMGGDGGTTPPV